MGLIGVFFLAVLGIFGAAISRQLTDEFKAWTPWFINYLIQSAVRQLPENQRERFSEEWQSHVDEIPGEVGKLCVAFGYLQASWKMSRGLADDIFYAVSKRAVDIAFSALWLIAFLPIYLLSSLFIMLKFSGSIFDVALRQGHKQNTIRLLKFRTAIIPRDDHTITQGPHGALRATAYGESLLRRSSGLDKLPMVLNVLSGELSLVGPRPLRLSEYELIDKHMPRLVRRMNVKPGLFGWASVNGFRREAATLEELKSELEHDLYYVDNRSFIFDLKILIMELLKNLTRGMK